VFNTALDKVKRKQLRSEYSVGLGVPTSVMGLAALTLLSLGNVTKGYWN